VATPHYVPIDGRPPRLTVGLRALDLADWLEVDDRRDEELRAKDVLLAERHDDVVATRPEGDAAAQELLELVIADVETRGLVELRAGDAVDLQSGRSVPVVRLHPIDAAARLVQEDLCVLVPDAGGRLVLAAASVCSPSRWSLAEKVGQDVRAIHEPVPGYDEAIGAPVDLAMEKLTAERPMWRVQWTLLDDPAAFQPEPPSQPRSIDTTNAGEQVWFRVERQTIRRLPRTGCVVFTIRTYVSRLDALGPTALRDLAATLQHVDADLADYRGWDELLPAVRSWLAR
jgi:hypothetical protein